MKSAKKQNKQSKKKTVKSNVNLALAGSFTNVPARFSSGVNSVTIRHRELLGPVESTVLYSLAMEKDINPGLIGTFPWLARVAANFETYKFRSLQFEYEPSCAATTAGNVYIAVDFDVSDPSPSNEMEISSFAGSVCTQAYGRARMDCPLNRMMGLGNERYVRVGTLAANQDNKTYDVGKLVIGVAGGPAGGRLGLIWVTYTVDLITPGIPTDSSFEESGLIDAGGAVSRLEPIGSAPTITQGLSTPVNGAQYAHIEFTDPGEYLLNLFLDGTGLTGGAPDTSASTNCTVGRIGGVANAAGTTVAETFRVKVLEPFARFAINMTAVATTVTHSLTRVAPYKYTLT